MAGKRGRKAHHHCQRYAQCPLKLKQAAAKKSIRDLSGAKSKLETAANFCGPPKKSSTSLPALTSTLPPASASAERLRSNCSIVWDRRKRRRLAMAMKLLEFVEGSDAASDSVSGSESDWGGCVDKLQDLLPGEFFGICDECRSRTSKLKTHK